MPRTLEEVQRLYARHHEMALDKRSISKDQKELMDAVKEYLQVHPEGFEVMLTDARDRTYNYHVSLAQQTRAVVDKGSIAYELSKKGVTVGAGEVTPGFIAEMVEAGYLSAEMVRATEDVSAHNAVKKVKRPRRSRT